MNPPPDHPQYLGARHFPSLDGLRCLCILGVIWHHHVPIHSTLTGWRLAERGFLGVDMFFVLSGFLIVTLLLRERDFAGGISLGKFYARRALRIFPIYYLLLFGVLAVYAVFKPGDPQAQTYFGELPYFLTYTSNWVPIESSNMQILWSLATEEQFYLVWPGVEMLLRGRAYWAVYILALVVNQLINFDLLPLNAGEFADATFTPILLGVGLAHLLHDAEGYRFARRLAGHAGVPVVLLVSLISLTGAAPQDIAGWPRLAVQVMMAMLLMTLVVMPANWLSRPLNAAAARRVGVISYGMYLYHMWVIDICRRVAGKVGLENHYAFFVMAVVATVAVAEISFRVIERPLLKLKSRFSRRPEAG